MKNMRTCSEQEAKLSAGKRRTRKLAVSKKRGNRSKKQILDRVSIFDDLDDLLSVETISEENELSHEEYHSVFELADSSEPLDEESPVNLDQTDNISEATVLDFLEAEAESPKESEKVQRRRQIDPTTCERDYSDDEIEFMNALDTYKRNSGRMFPTCSEILEVLLSLGYRKTDQTMSTAPEPDQTPIVQTPATPAFLSSDDYREPLAIF